MATCQDCKGSGSCQHCQGRSRMASTNQTCERCKGSGKCASCGGSGQGR